MMRRLAIGVVALGALLRLLLCLSTLYHPTAPGLVIMQADNYLGAADYLLQHGHIPDPVFMPGYAAVIAALKVLFPGKALGALLLLQWLLSTACIPVAMRIGNDLGGRRTALLTGVLVAFDPLLAVQPSLVLTEGLYVPLLLFAVAMFLACWQRQTRTQHIAWTLLLASGTLVGLAILTRTVGLLAVAAMLAFVVLRRGLPWRDRVGAAGAVCLPVLLLTVPLCIANQKQYGHFALSSSSGFNMAALVVGPAKSRFDHPVNAGLLDMWGAELGPGYQQEPPFTLAANASKVAVAWARLHLRLTLISIVRGQIVMLAAPSRESWAAALTPLHWSARSLAVFDDLLALLRLGVSMLAFVALLRWRSLRLPMDVVLLFVVLIVGHTLSAGGSGFGRFVTPVAPLLDVLAALQFAALLSRRGRELPDAVGP